MPGLIFTACFSRHQFVWPTFTQTTEDVIAGFEAAWLYFGGVFPVVIPDNMGSIVVEAENTAPRFNDVFFEYAQSRGFSSTRPGWRPRRTSHGWSGRCPMCATTSSPARPSPAWPTAGTGPSGGAPARRACAARHHPVPSDRGVPGRGTAPPVVSAGRAVRRPEMVRAEGSPRLPRRGRQGDLLGPAPPDRPAGQGPAGLDDGEAVLPRRTGETPSPQGPGQRSTDPADLPTGTEIYATRDIDRLRRMAAEHGEAIGVYAAALLDTPLPWTKMRQVYRLLGLVKKWGPTASSRPASGRWTPKPSTSTSSAACSSGPEKRRSDARPEPVVIQGRFARDPSEFATAKEAGR